MNNSFRLKVADMFKVRDRIVFVGALETQASVLNNVPAKLLINGAEFGRITINGEVLDNTSERSLWTDDQIDLKREQIVGRDTWLINL